MNPHDAAPVDAVVAAVVAHLQAHPLAADSALGVARWWIGGGHAGASLDDVETALELLVRRGVLRRLRLVDGTALYSSCTATRQ